MNKKKKKLDIYRALNERMHDRVKNSNRKERELKRSLSMEIVPHIPKGKQPKIHLPPIFPNLPKIQEIIAIVKSKGKKRQLKNDLLLTSEDFYNQEALKEICEFNPNQIEFNSDHIDFNNNIGLELPEIKKHLNNDFKRSKGTLIKNCPDEYNEYD
jgi:hypothetical protein